MSLAVALGDAGLHRGGAPDHGAASVLRDQGLDRILAQRLQMRVRAGLAMRRE